VFCHEYKSIFIGMFRIKVGDSSFPAENGQVDLAKGMDYSSAVRSILCLAPDVIMISELPDLTTITIVFKAANEALLALSSLNTNSAPEALTYLRRLVFPLTILLLRST